MEISGIGAQNREKLNEINDQSPGLGSARLGGHAVPCTRPPDRKIRSDACLAELEATNATTNGLKAAESQAVGEN